jgi:hypothetical protein
VSLVYDGDGNRVSETVGSTTTKYLVDDKNPTGYSQVMDELVSGSVTRTYAYGLQRISENQLVGSTWTPSFYGYDGHGNVRFLTSSSGTVGNTYTFDAFGAQIASTGTTPNPYLYSGERFGSRASKTRCSTARSNLVLSTLAAGRRSDSYPAGRLWSWPDSENRLHRCKLSGHSLRISYAHSSYACSVRKLGVSLRLKIV